MTFPRSIVTLAALALPAAAQLELAPLFADGAVLQRDARVAVWGWSSPGDDVTVGGSWSDARATTIAGTDGSWSVTLDTPGAGGPHTLTVAAGDERVAIDDVLLGEVWLASGQSNMEWTIAQTRAGMAEDPGYAARLATLEVPTLRIFDVKRHATAVPQTTCEGAWTSVAPDTLDGLSAVATFFGERLVRELDVPIGIVASNWGGTTAEAWTSERALAAFPEFRDALEFNARVRADPERVAREREDAAAQWWRDVDADDRGLADGWHTPDFDDGDWATIELPGLWEQSTLPNVDGLVWFRREVELPGEWAARDLWLTLGPIDDMDSVWVNGERVAGLERPGVWTTPREYLVSADAWRAGRNVIAVRAVDTGGAGGFAGRPDQLAVSPQKPNVSRRATMPLDGTWRHRPSTPTVPGWPQVATIHQNSPSALHHGMITPITPYTVAGVIWYQGESNRMRAEQYRRLFPAMIADWRRVFARDDLPFLFVQIAPYGYGGDTGQAAALREAQAFTDLTVPHTGMAVTMDVGNPRDIHPADKVTVAERLARLALHDVYGRDVDARGPTVARVSREGVALRVHLDHAEGLTTSDGDPVRHVELAGADGVFHEASARIDGTTLVVTSPRVAAPVEVRLSWGAADDTNLVDGSGLPSSSFRAR